jgi:hypothetical protein
VGFLDVTAPCHEATVAKVEPVLQDTHHELRKLSAANVGSACGTLRDPSANDRNCNGLLLANIDDNAMIDAMRPE